MLGFYCGRLTSVVLADIQTEKDVVELGKNLHVEKLIVVHVDEVTEEFLQALDTHYPDLPKTLITLTDEEREGWKCIQVPIMSLQTIQYVMEG